MDDDPFPFYVAAVTGAVLLGVVIANIAGILING